MAHTHLKTRARAKELPQQAQHPGVHPRHCLRLTLGLGIPVLLKQRQEN